MRTVWKTIRAYLSDPETNIFRNCYDALGGMLVLLALPLLSLISTFWIETPQWQNYVFPILSICFSAAYDTYGRYQHGEKRNVKLGFRLCCDFTALFLCALVTGIDCGWLMFLPPILLLLPGLLLVEEIYTRIKTAILISQWAV